MYYPLKLVINPKNWGLFVARKADPAFQHVARKILERDQYRCQFCGFHAEAYQEIVNLDGNYRNNKLSNMVTACPLCAQCGFVEAVGRNDFGGGRLIYFNEMTQNELNSLCHVLFCAMFNETAYYDTAQRIYRSLKFRAQPVEDKFGETASHPHVFGKMLIEQYSDLSLLSEKIFKDLRLLPTYASFKPQLEEWSTSAAEELAMTD
jgi:intracellular multiplication protein IcmJ